MLLSMTMPCTSSMSMSSQRHTVPRKSSTVASPWRSPRSAVLLLVLCFIVTVEAGPGGSCLACTNRTELGQLRVEKLKRQLLSSLGLKAPIRIPRDAIPSQSIIDRIQRQAEEEDARSESVERTYIFAQESPRFPASDLAHPTFVFPASDVTRNKVIQQITLQVFLHGLERAMSHEVEIRVFERFVNGSLGDVVQSRRVRIPHRHSGYFDVLLDVDDVKRWWDDEAEDEPIYAGVYVEARHNGHSLVALPGTADEEGTYIEVDHHESRREKRAPPTCSAASKETGCCLYDLHVNFDDAGWEFVLAPKFYNAYICAGDCSKNNVELSRYAHTQMTDSGRRKLSSNVCCHPSEYEPINIIYINENKEVVMSKVSGMIARRCACA